jgi:hypothetical protein
MIAKTSELTKDLVKRESLMFQRYQVDAKDIKCVLEWWEKHESLFPIVIFLACPIFGIEGSQFEIKRIFSLVGMLTNLRRCCK